MSIRMRRFGLFNTNNKFVWGSTSARAIIKLFYLRGKDVSLPYSRYILHGYDHDTTDAYLNKIKKVIRDN